MQAKNPDPRSLRGGFDDKPWLDMYSKDIRQRPIFSRQEECRLIDLAQGGDQKAKDLCARSLLPMVLKLATQAQKKYYWVKVMDLIGAGHIGLLTALAKFEPGKNTRLSTYATFWIRRYIRQEVADSRFIKVPETTGAQIGKIKRAIYFFETKYGFSPSLGDLAKSLKRPVSRVRQVLAAMAEVVSDLNTFSDTEFTPDDEAPHQRFTDPEAAAENSLLREKLLSALRVLTLREREIIKLFFGLGRKSAVPHTLEEIGQALGVTREAVRQTKEIALKKLLCRVDLTKCL